MKNRLIVSVLPGIVLVAILVASCGGPPRRQMAGTAAKTGSAGITRAQLYSEVGVKKSFIRLGTYGRKSKRPMRPRYITVHSTQNYSGDAYAHAKALRNGKLRAPKRKGGNRIGYLTWHFTVQDDVAIQHLPTNEQGEHADFDGPGNNYSIGIEMAEHRSNSRAQTLDRTAKLCASLMHEYNIPLGNVVPHYHWPRRGTSPLHKNCPHFLMDNGRPGAKWKGFLNQVNFHYNRIRSPASA